ncbi:MAG: S26 family signal peptidase [Actinomycetota bacterium]
MLNSSSFVSVTSGIPSLPVSKHTRFVVLTLACIVALLALASRRYQPVIVRGDSMQPTLRPGDRLAVLPRGSVERGSIVVMRSADGLPIVKRVAALGGDRYKGAVIPEGEVFVAGDNRWASTDSNDFGTVPQERIEGVVVALWWPLARVRTL